MRENHSRWYEYVLRKYMNAIVRRNKMINISGKRRDKGRSKKTLIKIINEYLNALNFTKNMVFYRSQ